MMRGKNSWRQRLGLALAALLLGGCGTQAAPSLTPASTITIPPTATLKENTPTPTPHVYASATAIPTAAPPLSPVQLKYVLIQNFGPVGEESNRGIFYCDPDSYPVARDEQQLALERFAAIESDSEKFQILLQRTGLEHVTQFSAGQKLKIYQEDKKLNAIHLEPAGEVYTFRLNISDGQSGKGSAVEGTIDRQGVITIIKKEPVRLDCPICLARDTRIDTPNGVMAVQDLRPGMAVWTTDAAGARVAAVIAQTARVPVSANHQFIRLLLDDGRELVASPGHPLADGRTLGTLGPGDGVDGAQVVVAERVPSKTAVTYDILPTGASGLYWANGILVASTLVPAARFAVGD